MKKLSLILIMISVFLSSLLIPNGVQADGMILPPDYYPVYETSQKALIVYKDNKEDLVISISFSGKATDFGWVVPFPNKPEISKVDSSIFRKLSTATEPKQNLLEKLRGEDYSYSMYGVMELAAPAKDAAGETTVEVIEEESIGIFDYAILKAEDPEDLKEWMEENSYNLPTGSEDEDDYYYPYESSDVLTQTEAWSEALPIFQDYIDDDWFFVTVKVSNKFQESTGVETQLEEGAVDPLRFSFDTTDMIYPMKLTSLSRRSVDVLLYIIDDHKVWASNYISDYCSSDGETCSHFDTQYASKINKEDIEEMTKEIGKGSWYTPDQDMYITKLYASYLSYEYMEEDVLFEDTSNNQGVNDGSMSTWEWIQLPFVFLVYLPYLVLGGFFDMIDSGGYDWSYGLGTAWFIGISLLLFVGSVIWILISTILLVKTRKRFKRVLLYLLQFPSVWFVGSTIALLGVIPFAIAVGVLAQNEVVTLIDSFCCFSLMAALLPLVFYRLLWRRKKRKKK